MTFVRKMPRILRNNCLKNIFSRILGGGGTCPALSPLLRLCLHQHVTAVARWPPHTPAQKLYDRTTTIVRENVRSKATNVNSRVFFGFSKKRKKRILELCLLRTYLVISQLGLLRLCSAYRRPRFNQLRQKSNPEPRPFSSFVMELYNSGQYMYS